MIEFYDVENLFEVSLSEHLNLSAAAASSYKQTVAAIREKLLIKTTW